MVDKFMVSIRVYCVVELVIFQESDSVTNRVAGFVCKYVFCEHESCVTSLVVIEKENSDDSTYLVCTLLQRSKHKLSQFSVTSTDKDKSVILVWEES